MSETENPTASVQPSKRSVPGRPAGPGSKKSRPEAKAPAPQPQGVAPKGEPPIPREEPKEEKPKFDPQDESTYDERVSVRAFLKSNGQLVPEGSTKKNVPAHRVEKDGVLKFYLRSSVQIDEGTVITDKDGKVYVATEMKDYPQNYHQICTVQLKK